MELNTPTGLHNIFLGPRGLRPGWRAGLYLALFLLFLFLLQGLATLLHGRIFVSEHVTPGILLAGEAAQAICAIAAALVMARMEARRFDEFGMPLRGVLRTHFWRGVLWGLGEITALVLVIRALGGYSFGDLALGRGEAVKYALIYGVLFLAVALYEEFFFRGYLQFTVASGMGFWGAAVLLSAIFGAVHLSNPGEGPVGALGVFLIGMFYCFTLRRTGTLWFAIGSHAAFDFGETYLYSVPNSGLVLPGQLLSASLHGPRWLTGGTVGPEGSIVSFAILAVMFVIFNRLYRPKAISETRELNE
jgi:membrane protease YdiL (CAAX protease family)